MNRFRSKILISTLKPNFRDTIFNTIEGTRHFLEYSVCGYKPIQETVTLHVIHHRCVYNITRNANII